MSRPRREIGIITVFAISLSATGGNSQNVKVRINPASPSGLDYYAQGGVVVDGVAYFTASDGSRRKGVKRNKDFRCVVAFDLKTFKKIRSYNFTNTYDSSPLVFQRKDGTWLVIAHEHKMGRTVALNRDTGAVEWISAANQPGTLFFGFSYFVRDDGSKLILVSCTNGLHAVSSETGKDVWWVKARSWGGVTPCVDQKNGLVFYQCGGKVMKIRAIDGHVIKEVSVSSPNRCISWNTVLVNDAHGYFIATRWYGKPEWDSAIRVYDKDLNLRWEHTGLPNGKKDTLTYVDGKLICGSGNGWSKKYTGAKWKYIAAYAIPDGKVVWKCDLSKHDYTAIANLPYFNGYLYGENGGSPPQTTKCFRINATNGKLEEVYDYGRMITSCATQIIAHGKILSGDLWEDGTVVTEISDGSKADWPGPFGDPRTNQMAVPREPNVKLVPVKEAGRPNVAEHLALNIGLGPPPGTDGKVNRSAKNLALKAKLKPSRSLKAGSYSIDNVTDGEPTRNSNVKKCESCWAGDSANLLDSPLDFIVDFGKPQTINRIAVTTCRLKNQQRLTGFDVYGWAGTDWDGGRPLAAVRNSTLLRMECWFDPVTTSKVCIRLFDNARTTHNFPHISELEVYATDATATRALRPVGLAKPLSELKSAAELEAEVLRLRSLEQTRERPNHIRRLELAEKKLMGLKEEAKWIKQLSQIDLETKQLLKSGIPEWAAAQREALAKYVLWIHWWIDHQQPDGQFGGTWNDDVELVCGWPVACLAASDEKTFNSLRLLADGVWNWGPVGKHGYSKYTDVEHSAEEISYSQPRMAVLDYGNAKWVDRCRTTVETCLREFMAANPEGMLQFKSDWFGFRNGKAAIDSKRSFDIPQCAKALKPGLYAAWHGDEKMKSAMIEYGDTWLDAALQEYEGKPRGLIPARIDFGTGKPSGICTWMPVMRATHYHLIGCYLLTDDPKYLVPAQETIRYYLVENNVGDLPLFGKTRGREHIGIADQLAVVASMWRTLTSDRRFDAWFERWSRKLAKVMGERYESYAYADRKKADLWIREPLEVGAFRLAPGLRVPVLHRLARHWGQEPSGKRMLQPEQQSD
ncbi:MAG: PQQ-binding-like beta-propeller repeat protein [Planctomycetota bacterium]|jgi:hypothetical protein|nr:PQQ-binding-like beta-propeller repeat protein [Planctomycetota bacterium]